MRAEDLTALADKVRGRVIRPGDEDFDQARAVWNGMVDRKPAVIVRCAGTADVVAALDLARQHNLPISVRGGGHNVAGKAVCADGCMIDLSEMDDVRVDAGARRAQAGPGATWGQLDHETQSHGLATTGGVDSRTGIAGLTLGGGMGWLARSCGLATDNLVRAEVVLADGSVVHASADEHPDLFWALRGGGGNCGIVTSFEYQLHEVGPEVAVAQVFYPLDQARDVLRGYARVARSLPDASTCYALFVPTPPGEPFPEDQHGKPALALVACHNGPTEEGIELFQPLQSLGTPKLAVIEPMPYTALQQAFNDGAPDGARYYWKSEYLDEVADGFVDALVSGIEGTELPGPFSMAFIEHMGGAIGRVDRDATAFPHRDVAYALGIQAGWEDPAADDRAMAWAKQLYEAIRPFGNGAVYANYLDQDEDDRVEAAYRSNLDRLQQVKATYDPDNVFNHNANVVPVAAAG